MVDVSVRKVCLYVRVCVYPPCNNRENKLQAEQNVQKDGWKHAFSWSEASFSNNLLLFSASHYLHYLGADNHSQNKDNEKAISSIHCKLGQPLKTYMLTAKEEVALMIHVITRGMTPEHCQLLFATTTKTATICGTKFTAGQWPPGRDLYVFCFLLLFLTSTRQSTRQTDSLLRLIACHV